MFRAGSREVALESDIADKFAPPEAERRAWPRYTAEREVSLAIEVAGRRHNCLVKDISLGGARLSCDEELPNSEEIVFIGPAFGPSKGKRHWHAAGEIGIEFDFSDETLSLISQCLRAMLHDDSQQRSVNH